MYRSILSTLLSGYLLLAVSCTQQNGILPVPPEAIRTGGVLAVRIDRNFDRLEDEM